jgi:hypothetical protein
MSLRLHPPLDEDLLEDASAVFGCFIGEEYFAAPFGSGGQQGDLTR